MSLKDCSLFIGVIGKVGKMVEPLILEVIFFRELFELPNFFVKGR